MKEFIKKLIGRLEELIEHYHCFEEDYFKGRIMGYVDSKIIVNQLAEEYNGSNDSMEIQIAKNYDRPIICSTCECGSDFEEVVMTNADKIRSMSDEELAEFLLKVNTAYAEPCMLSGGDCKWEDYPTHDKGCKDCFLEYLRKEAE